MKNLIFIILGATGDLAKRKLFPALYKLVASKKLENFFIVGAAKDDVSASEMLAQAKSFVKNSDGSVWKQIEERTRYHKLDFESSDDFDALAKMVTSLQKEYSVENRLVYLAAPADFFCGITELCAHAGIVKRVKEDQDFWHRIVYEKPFGKDLASAQKINECIQKHFEEAQAYRIDHYLTKETVSNIAMIRFSNCVLEPLWNNRFVDNVQIFLSEDLCVNGRGAYYDKYGALRDVVQNHIFELIALVAMEAPENLVGDKVRQERVRVLKHLKLIDGILGQYEGYKKEKGVEPDSKTETFASLLLRVENERWSGVPFYIRTGKCLQKKETVIFIKFKQVDCLLTKGCPMESNFLKIQIDPDSRFALSLNVKKPGTMDELIPVNMEFCHSCEFASVTPQAYETIFQQVLQGENSISVRFDEIEIAWKLIDEAYQKNFPLYAYKRGTKGPDELKTFAQKHGVRWLL